MVSEKADKKPDLKAAKDRGERIALMEPPVLGEGSRHRDELTDLALELAQRNAGFPAGVWTSWLPSCFSPCGSRLVGRYPGWQRGPRRLPSCLFQGTQWLIDEGGIRRCRLLDRCGGSAGWLGPMGSASCFPLNCAA